MLQLKATTSVQGHHHLQFFSQGAIGDVEPMDILEREYARNNSLSFFADYVLCGWVCIWGPKENGPE